MQAALIFCGLPRQALRIEQLSRTRCWPYFRAGGPAASSPVREGRAADRRRLRAEGPTHKSAPHADGSQSPANCSQSTTSKMRRARSPRLIQSDCVGTSGPQILRDPDTRPSRTGLLAAGPPALRAEPTAHSQSAFASAFLCALCILATLR